MQDHEIIRYRLKDYIGESFGEFDSFMLDYNFEPPLVIQDDKLFHITKPTTLFDSGEYSFEEYTNPIKDTTTILRIFDRNSFERTYLMFLNEAYQIKIVNMTFYELRMNKEVYSLDILPIINRDVPKTKLSQNSSNYDKSGMLRILCKAETASIYYIYIKNSEEK